MKWKNKSQDKQNSQKERINWFVFVQQIPNETCKNNLKAYRSYFSYFQSIKSTQSSKYISTCLHYISQIDEMTMLLYAMKHNTIIDNPGTTEPTVYFSFCHCLCLCLFIRIDQPSFYVYFFSFRLLFHRTDEGVRICINI